MKAKGTYGVSKKASGSAAGNSEAIRIYEKMEEERKRKLAAKAEASKSKRSRSLGSSS